MVVLTASGNLPEFLKSFDDLAQRQVPQALVWALNEMADEVLKGVQSDIDKNFDRPTNWTKNSMMVWRATKRSLSAEVRARPSVGSRHYLKVQEAGGPRPQTGLEKLFARRMPYDGHIQAVIPAAAALRDGFGNWSTGERNRVLSAVQAQGDKSSNSKRKVSKRSAKQFFVPRAGSKLSPGVWKRTSKRATIRKVLHFSQRVPRYQPRLSFIEGASRRAQKNFPAYFARAMERALASAR